MRDSFVFYRSFAEGIKCLSEEDQLRALWDIIDYALNDDVPVENGIAEAVFNMAKPQIDRNNTRYQNGLKGGRPKNQTETKTKPNNNQTVTKPKPNVNVNDNDNVNVNDNVNENDVHIAKTSTKAKEKNIAKGDTPLYPPKGKTKADQMIESFKRMLPDYNFSMALISAIEDWCTYKIEKKQPYTETGVKKFLNEVDKQWKHHGESAVIDIIDQTMASGYQGITWDRISKVKPVESTADRVRKVDEFI